MATELATAYISLVPSAKGIKGNIERELGGAGSDAAKTTESAFTRAAKGTGGAFKAALKGAAVGVAGLFAAGAVGAKAAIGAASDYNESLSKIGAVFGPDAQKEIETWAKTAATSFGQSSGQALEAAGTFGNLLTSFGLGRDQAQGMSTDMVQLASDLASFNNTSPEEALDALRSGLTGETEPLKKFGVALDDASLRAKALALGISDGKSVLTPAQKAQAAYALILERTKNAQGDFAKTSGGLANQQRIFAARTEDLKVKIGQALLPAMNALLPVLSSLFDRIGPLIDRALPMLRRGFESISDWWAQNGPAIMATAKQVLDALVTGFQAVSSWVVDNWPTISDVISSVIGTVRTVIEGAVSVITTLWKNFGDNILSFVQRAWPPIKQVVEGVLTTVRGIIQTITSLIKGDWSGVWEGIKGIFSGVWNALQGIVKTALEAVRLVIGAALEVIGSAWKGIWEGLTNFVRDKIDAVAGFFTDLPGRLARVGSGMFDFIKESFRAALNFVIRAWNSLEFSIPGFNPPGPGSFPGFTVGTPDLPEFHDGGVVPGRPGQEVLALLKAGERVLTPEQQMGGGVVINANGLTAQEAADFIPRAIAWQARGMMGPG